MGLKYQEVCKVYITSGIIVDMKIEPRTKKQVKKS